MPQFPFVQTNGFTPNNAGWLSVGPIDSFTQLLPTSFLLAFGIRSLQLTVLGPTAFRLRFNPAPGASYAAETAVAVVSRDRGAAGLTGTVAGAGAARTLDTGQMRIALTLTPAFSLAVYRGSQLVHRDAPGQGVLYIDGATVIANMKTYPANARYVGLGEQAGGSLLKNEYTMTFFNFDNYMYSTGPIPSGAAGGPLNPQEPLYGSMPLLVEVNPQPVGDFAGAPYACGVFLDNPGQSFVNIGASDYSDMSGKYYFGALFGELDYYFMLGDAAPAVLAQYTTLTGRSPMPPAYVFGYHQGAYGYFDRYHVAMVANSYRSARIPCDGLHIDVDFQDNYRMFTWSAMKFANVNELFQDLHGIGFKQSTNISPFITNNVLDENGKATPYPARNALLAVAGLLTNDRAGGAASGGALYQGGVNYGNNFGSNPYPYPPLAFRGGKMPLTSPGNYPDLGRQQVRQVWGDQYGPLIGAGLDMIWQDMTCPAIDSTLPPGVQQDKSFPQDLLVSVEDSTGAVTKVPFANVRNSYALNLLRATWEGDGKLRPARRTFIIARGGYAGLQRYAGLWTGDSASTWDFLRINVPEVLGLGLAGVPISGCDIGGFAATGTGTVVDGMVVGNVTNYELLTRWMQLGSFLPWFRNHYDGYNKEFQEPYRYAEPVPSNCRKYVEQRYRMLQVYYDAMYEWTQTGMPIARALFLNDPADPAVYAHLDDQIFVSRDFQVAPILAQYETLPAPQPPIRSVYLPAGSDWYAFQDNRAPIVGAVAGGTLIGNYYADLSLVPIYVRAGAILPFRHLEQWVGQLAQP